MHFQFLIEDWSGEVLIRHVMENIKKEDPKVSYDCKSFGGIGGFRKTSKLSDVKTNKLLNDLQMYLRGFDKSLRGIGAAIFIVLDNDTRETEIFRQQLAAQAIEAMITTDYVFCIAVEEMEAWLLGDREAVFTAYPKARENIYKEYKQDSICGTWETLANIVFSGGMKEFKKECPTYREVGKYKAKWADDIGRVMELDRNVSPSFNEFINELRMRIHTA